MEFSDYIVYADESGDHSLTSINPQNPVFVLAFCIFEKRPYYETIVPTVQRLKFDFWGHDCVVLHSHEIRKAHGDFNVLQNAHIRMAFMERVNELMGTLPFTIIAAAIDKQRHVRRYSDPANPYEIALTFCMERLQRWLREHGQDNKLTHLISSVAVAPRTPCWNWSFGELPRGATKLVKCPTSISAASWTRSIIQRGCSLRI